VRAVGALAPTRLEQPVLTRRLQHPRKQAIDDRIAQQSAAKLAQHAAVEARVPETHVANATSRLPHRFGANEAVHPTALDQRPSHDAETSDRRLAVPRFKPVGITSIEQPRTRMPKRQEQAERQE